MDIPNVLVKAIEFKNLNVDDIIAFLQNHEKTQIVNEARVFGEKHVIHSVSQTLKAFANNENITRKESLEFLLRLGGVRQINKALDLCKPAQRSVFVCWSADARKIFDEFREKFSVKEIPLRSVSENEEMDAIERSATFWLD